MGTNVPGYYRVECVGEVREVYTVKADSREDAMARCTEGDLIVSVSSSVEAVSAEFEEE